MKCSKFKIKAFSACIQIIYKPEYQVLNVQSSDVLQSLTSFKAPSLFAFANKILLCTCKQLTSKNTVFNNFSVLV